MACVWFLDSVRLVQLAAAERGGYDVMKATGPSLLNNKRVEEPTRDGGVEAVHHRPADGHDEGGGGRRGGRGGRGGGGGGADGLSVDGGEGVLSGGQHGEQLLQLLRTLDAVALPHHEGGGGEEAGQVLHSRREEDVSHHSARVRGPVQWRG